MINLSDPACLPACLPARSPTRPPVRLPASPPAGAAPWPGRQPAAAPAPQGRNQGMPCGGPCRRGRGSDGRWGLQGRERGREGERGEGRGGEMENNGRWRDKQEVMWICAVESTVYTDGKTATTVSQGGSSSETLNVSLQQQGTRKGDFQAP